MTFWQIVGAVSLFGPFAAVMLWGLWDWLSSGCVWQDIKDLAISAGLGLTFLTWIVGSVVLMIGGLS